MPVHEKDISQVWAEVIGIDVTEIDVDANFFDLGGYSLLLIKLVDELNSVLGIQTNVVTVLEHSSVEALVAHLNAQEEVAESEAR